MAIGIHEMPVGGVYLMLTESCEDTSLRCRGSGWFLMVNESFPGARADVRLYIFECQIEYFQLTNLI